MGETRALSREEVREIDRRAIEQFGLPGIVLMENAGRGAAELLLSLGVAGPVVIMAGKGNNGGDGFVIARHLENHGCDVRVLLVCDPAELKGDALANYRVLAAAGTPLWVNCGLRIANCGLVIEGSTVRERIDDALSDADWIVDALLGTGTQGEIRAPYDAAIEAINRAGAKVLAVDLPSGLDCDTGRPLGPCVKAGHTATFVARKLGFDAPGAEEYTGRVHVIDIGVPRRMVEGAKKSKSRRV